MISIDEMQKLRSGTEVQFRVPPDSGDSSGKLVTVSPTIANTKVVEEAVEGDVVLCVLSGAPCLRIIGSVNVKDWFYMVSEGAGPAVQISGMDIWGIVTAVES